MRRWPARAVCLLVLFHLPTAVCPADEPAREPVGRGARLFVTKVYPSHGKLTPDEFTQLSDTGFTVVVSRWQEKLPEYCRKAAAAGLDAMAWMRGMGGAQGPTDQTINRLGKPTRYAVPHSPAGWQEITNKLLERARISLDLPNFRGVILDFEIYGGNKTDGYCESYDDATFAAFLQSIGKPVPDPLTPADKRKQYLEVTRNLGNYIEYQRRLIAEQARILRGKVDAVNPYFQIGTYGWGVMYETVLSQVATRKAPALDINAMTYGRAVYTRPGPGYDPDRPDRLGLKWSLIINQQMARRARSRDYPVVLLGGHYPQAPGPQDGTQYKFTVRQSFNSAAYADGYWIWTDWHTPQPWEDKQQWIDAMMDYWRQANAALDVGDSTWANRQSQQIADPDATAPGRIATTSGREVIVWDPVAGRRIEVAATTFEAVDWNRQPLLDGAPLRINGHCAELTDADSGKVLKRFEAGHGLRSIATGDVDRVAGQEVVTLNAGWVKIWDPESEALLLRFHVGNDQTRLHVKPAP